MRVNIRPTKHEICSLPSCTYNVRGANLEENSCFPTPFITWIHTLIRNRNYILRVITCHNLKNCLTNRMKNRLLPKKNSTQKPNHSIRRFLLNLDHTILNRHSKYKETLRSNVIFLLSTLFLSI